MPNRKKTLQLDALANEDSFAGRLAGLIAPNSVRSFAVETGLPATTLTKYLGGSMPGLENLIIIAEHAGVTTDWLALGRGPKTHDGAVVRDAELPSQFRLIPRLPVQPSSGFGTMVADESPTEMLAFRSDWLRRVGINPDFAHVLTNRGDSNEPTIRDGDILLVDTSIDRVVDNAFYIVVYQGNALLKRVQMLRDGSIVLSSDNKLAYRDEVVSPDDVPDLRIAARLMWFGRSI